MMTCREDIGFLTKLFRFTDYKTATPFNIEIKTATGEPVVTVRRGVNFWASKVEVLDENGQLVGMVEPVRRFGG